MNSKTNRNAITRYTNTGNRYCTSVQKHSVKYVDGYRTKTCQDYDTSSWIPMPLNIANGAFLEFTNSLSYYKTKLQKKHYDKCSTPYKISMDNTGNAYIKWSNVHDVVISDAEIKAISKVVLMACDILSNKGVKLTSSVVKSYILDNYPNMYFNCVDVAEIVKSYKKIHEIKHKSDNECLVFRPKKPTISVGAKKLGTVVK